MRTKGTIIFGVMLLFAKIAAPAQAGPLSELYLASKTGHSGSNSTFDVIQGTTVNRSWTARHGNEIALAVSSKVRSLGLLNVAKSALLQRARSQNNDEDQTESARLRFSRRKRSDPTTWRGNAARSEWPYRQWNL